MKIDSNIKWILFDFGGCLDSDGVHSRTLFYNQFKLAGLADNLEQFQAAYSKTDQVIIEQSLLINATLYEMNELMCVMIAENLSIKNKSEEISITAKKITETQASYLRRNKSIIKNIKTHYHLGIISNFSGNLIHILNEFELTTYFDFVLDSYHVGFSKPSREIFQEAINRCGMQTNHICFLGDNLSRDILPSKQLGMKTIYINSSEESLLADYSINSLTELLELTQSKNPTKIQNTSTNR